MTLHSIPRTVGDMANLNLLPKDWTIDKDGKTYAYGTKWLPIRPIKGRETIIPRPRYDIEMLCFKSLRGLQCPKGFIRPPGVRTAYDHYKSISDEIWGVEDSIWPFEWNPYSERMLEFKLKYNFLMICGHQRSGKSDFIAHWLNNNFLFDPYNTKCLATSLTLKSARGKIWGKISECWQQACRRIAQIYGLPATEGEKYMPGKLLNAGIIKYSMGGVETEQAGLELVPGDETKARESSEKIQGYHRNRMFAGLDELASLSHGLMKTVKTNIFTDDQADVTGSFNPDSFFDPAGIACEPVNGGYKILTPDLMDWKIAGGWCIRFRGSSSPNMTGAGERYKYLLSREEYENKKAEMGEKSKEFCKMYEGTFSTTGTVEAIYDENEIIQYRGQQSITTDRLWYEEPQGCSFLDASYSHGGDWAAMAIGKLGWAKINEKRILVLEIQGDPIRLDADIDVKKDKSEQVVAAYIAKNKELGIQPKNSGVDISGNPTIYSLIARDWSKDILQLNFGETASENPISRTDHRPAKERYVRKVSEIWYAGKPLIRSEQLKGLTPTVILEMCNRTYKEVNGRIQVESKDDMRERSLRSPDNADAVLGLAYLCRDRMGLVAEERSAGVKTGSAYRRGAIAPKVARNLAKCTSKLSYQYGNGKALWRR